MAAQAGLCLAWSEIPEDTFYRGAAHILLTLTSSGPFCRYLVVLFLVMDVNFFISQEKKMILSDIIRFIYLTIIYLFDDDLSRFVPVLPFMSRNRNFRNKFRVKRF